VPGHPLEFVTQEFSQLLSKADIVGELNTAVLLQEQGAEAGDGRQLALAGIDDVHVVEEGNIEDVLFPGEFGKVLDGLDVHLAAADHNGKVVGVVAGRLLTELIG
jgi:hypothetical protein